MKFSKSASNYKKLANEAYLEEQLRRFWRLGRNILVNWSSCPEGIKLAAIPYYDFTPLFMNSDQVNESNQDASGLNADNISRARSLKNLISGSRKVAASQLHDLSATFGVDVLTIQYPYPESRNEVDHTTVDDIFRRYSVSYVENRAAMLIDIVGFSMHDPFIQTMQLNSLAYSINSAHSKLQSKGLFVDFARSTTGDGFYVWNRDQTSGGNQCLYFLMNLVLADNAIARQMAVGDSTPLLKTAFHIGDCYEFYLTEALKPSAYSYIVGDLTIELARIIENAIPGQILVGDFKTRASLDRQIDSTEFIAILAGELSCLKGMELSGSKVKSISCYITGELLETAEYSISKFEITDKHEQNRIAYNAKVNILRDFGSPIYLGIQDKTITHLRRMV